MHRTTLLITGIALLAACTDGAEKTRPEAGAPEAGAPDAGPDPGPLICGAHGVVQGGCAARCPAPCTCVVFFDDFGGDPGFVPFELCGTPCDVPGSCPGDERCSLLGSDSSGQAVCLPRTLQTPSSTTTGAMVDCFPSSTSMTRPRCLGDRLVQYQPFLTQGSISGSYCADVLLELCPGGCVTPDAGPHQCRGAPDAGPPADGGVTCCPVGPFGGCTALGGTKLAPHGCRISCCAACKWTQGTDSHGCPTWTAQPLDGGTDA